MKSKIPSKRRDYRALGKLLKEARKKLYDEEAGPIPRVEDLAKLLSVTPSFVYQVEQGTRKPKDGQFGKWSSVYGVHSIEMWKCLGRIPMDLVATLREKPKPVVPDPFSQLSEVERTELISFLDYLRWRTNSRTSELKSYRS